MKVRGICQTVNGLRLQNQTCLASLTKDSDGDLIYAETAESGCSSGLVCNVANSSDADLLDLNLQGICEPEKCFGKKIPGNCNGNNPNDSDCSSATKRVTICHRTCSEKNPWVRLTIDDDAWNGAGCGHRQHDVRDECKNKAPWTAWGVNRMDYLLKEHGTRADVAARLNNKAAEKAYWKKWEPACPYVRNGKCCDWNDAENPCCGDAPGTTYTPEVEIKKYAGPTGQCSAAGISSLFDDTYTLTSATEKWQYCYVVSVPPTSVECLFQLKMSDFAPVGGTIGAIPIDITNGDADVMCPGDVKYIPGREVQGLDEDEGPYDALVTGRGILSLKPIESKASASIIVPPQLTKEPYVAPTPAPAPPTTAPVGFTINPGTNPFDVKLTGLSDVANNDASVGVIATVGQKIAVCPYANLDTPDCPEDVVLMNDLSTNLAFNPITIINQATDTVTFNITNPLGIDAVSLFYQYAVAESGANICYAESPFPTCQMPIQVTAHCMSVPGHTPLAIVDLWMVLGQASVIDLAESATVPKCCQPDKQDTSIMPTFLVSVKIYCESKCVNRIPTLR